jgi:four helix bundle protein
MHTLSDLKIWHRAIDLATHVYELTASFPTEEKYGLIAQIRRSVVSISSNIAEGAGRNSDNEFCYFLGVSNGSAYELQTQLLISRNLGLIDDVSSSHALDELIQLQKMNYALQNSLKKD